MTAAFTPTPDQIRAYRRENPKLRERDIAANLGIPEAALVAAEVGISATRLMADPALLLEHAPTFGEVMVLSRNDSAVHEKIGLYETIEIGDATSLTLGNNIDLRIFNRVWKHAFAVTKTDGEKVARSLQYFDDAGTAIHKVHLRPASDVAAYERFVELACHADQIREIAFEPVKAPARGRLEGFDAQALRSRWLAMTDTHQFHGLLKELDVDRLSALRAVGSDLAWPLAGCAVESFFDRAAAEDLPLMCFVANRGIVQIHTGPIAQIVKMGPWINVMDPTFHLHFRLDHVAEAWVVRKPTSDGNVTSLEVYGADGELLIQFFGVRKEGNVERADWRALVEGLPTEEMVAA